MRRRSEEFSGEVSLRAVNGTGSSAGDGSRRLSEQLNFECAFYDFPDGDRSDGIPADCESADCKACG